MSSPGSAGRKWGRSAAWAAGALGAAALGYGAYRALRKKPAAKRRASAQEK